MNFATESGVDDFYNRGYWLANPQNQLTKIIRAGDAVPGAAAGTEFYLLGEPPSVNNNGQSVFFAYLWGGGTTDVNDGSLWKYSPDVGLTLLAREGDQAPGAANGIVLSNLFDRSINGLGQVIFSSTIGTSGADMGLWSDRNGVIAPIMLAGDSLPGLGGTRCITVGGTGINNRGQILYQANFSGAGVTSENDFGLWLDTPGSGATIVVRRGDLAPGTPAATVFGAPPNDAYSFVSTLNSHGQVAFFSSLADSEHTGGIWAGDPGALELVMRKGDQAPGAPKGELFIGVPLPALNSRGQTAFFSFTTTEGASGIWATDLSGTLQLIVRTGQLLDVSDDPLHPDLRVVSRLSFASGQSHDEGAGRASGLNNMGQIAFNAVFTDGSQGYFVSNAVAVPEPSAWIASTAIATGLIVASRTRRRTR